MYAITRSINQYDQDGEYIHTIYLDRPTRNELRLLFYGEDYIPEIGPSNEEKFITHLLNGGGRLDYEYEWYFLTELKSGEEYNHKNK